MPERCSKRKTRRNSLPSSLGEPEASRLRTENIPSISDTDFSETSEKIEKSVCRRTKDSETGQGEILEMIENLSSKIDSLSNGTSVIVNTETDEIDPVNLGHTLQPPETCKLPRHEGQHRNRQASRNCVHLD